MLRKTLSEQTLNKQCARVSLTRKLPSDFFMPLEPPQRVPFRRLKKLSPINDENKCMWI